MNASVAFPAVQPKAASPGAERGMGWLCCCAQVISLTREDVSAVCKVSSELAALQSRLEGSSGWRLSVQGHTDMGRGPELPAGAEPLGCEHWQVPEANHRMPFQLYVTIRQTVTGRKAVSQRKTPGQQETEPCSCSRAAAPAWALSPGVRFEQPKEAHGMRAGGTVPLASPSSVSRLPHKSKPQQPEQAESAAGSGADLQTQLFWVKQSHMGTCWELPWSKP